MRFCPSVLRTEPCVPERGFSGEVVEVGASVPVARDLIRFFSAISSYGCQPKYRCFTLS
jgi:hypothetical protein